MGSGDAGKETGYAQVSIGPLAMDKLGTIVSGEAGFRYTTINDIV